MLKNIQFKTDKCLDESVLGEMLAAIFGPENVIKNKAFPGLKYKPDYRIENYKLIFEFDGPRHYTTTSRALTDNYVDSLYLTAGYKVIRFPYWIQPDVKLLNDLTGLSLPKGSVLFTYPNGFIHENVLLPADFCELGVAKFSHEYIANSIIKSKKYMTACRLKFGSAATGWK